MTNKEVVSVGAWIGGLTGTYSAAVCYARNNCTPKESWTLLGIYTGAGIGTMALLKKMGSSNKHSTAMPDRLMDFSGIQRTVKKGDRISIRDASGTTQEGVIETISGSSMKLRTGQSSREFSELEVMEIHRRRHAPSGQSLIPVAIVSLVASAVAIPNTNSGRWCSGKGAGTCVIGGAALGSALYLGLSSIPKRAQLVYMKPTAQRTTSIDWQIAPLVSKKTQGALLRVSF